MPVTKPPVANAIRLTSAVGNPPQIVIALPPAAGGTVPDGGTTVAVTVATNDFSAMMYLEVFDASGEKIGFTGKLVRNDGTPNVVTQTITLTSPFVFTEGVTYYVRCYAMIDGEITSTTATVIGIGQSLLATGRRRK